MPAPRYVVILQCSIVKERCSGFFCEDAFCRRTGVFAEYTADASIRHLTIDCGGCCGRATLRKLSHLLKLLDKHAAIGPKDVVLHFASCVCNESFHGPKCPHYDYLKTLVERKGITWREGTRISEKAASRRDAQGHWSCNA